jgi:predicted outer membrane repeat protein
MGILVSSEKLDLGATIAWQGSVRTFGEIMNLSDADFAAVISGDTESAAVEGATWASMDDFFQGAVSGAWLDSVEVVAGEQNAIQATLVPITGSAYTCDLNSTLSMTLPTAATTARRFFKVTNILESTPAAVTSLVAKLAPAADSTATLGAVIFYDELGKTIVAFDSLGALSQAKTYTGAVASGNTVYLYVEYQGTGVTASFDEKTEIPQLTLSLSGLEAYAGKNLYYRLVVDPKSSSIGADNARALGYLTVQSDGTGTIGMIDTTGAVADVAAGSYYLDAILDVDGSLDGTTDLSAVVKSDGDLCLEASVVAVTGRVQTISLSAADLTAYVDPTPTLTVSFSGGASYANKRVYVGVIDAAAITSALSSDMTDVAPSSIGIISLDAAGSGSAKVQAIGTGTPAVYTVGSTYVLTAMVDMDDTWSVTVPDVASATVSLISGMSPNYGDYASKGLGTFTAVTGKNEFAINPADLEFITDYVYFVSSTGTGTGLKPQDPSGLVSAVAAANARYATDSTAYTTLTLVGNATLSSAVSIASNLTITSLDQTGYTLSLSGTPNVSFLSVASGGTLNLYNLTIDGSQYAAGTVSAIAVASGGTVNLVKANVANLHTGVNGGAIYSSGGNVTLYSSTIKGCSAASGGAIYFNQVTVNDLSALYLGSGTVISGNTATASGGGVYANGAIVVVDSNQLGGMVAPSITGNTATVEGGGVYLTSTCVVTDPGTIFASKVVTGNTAPTNPDIANYGSIGSSISLMYVSSTGTATGTGFTPDSPVTLDVALATPSVTYIELLDDITVTSGITISRPLYISASTSQAAHIYLGADLTGPFVTVGSNSLVLTNVVLGPAASGTYSASTLVSVGASGYLLLSGNAGLQNNMSSTGDGGAINANGDGMTIALAGCTISNCGALNGGAIYVKGNSPASATNLSLSTGAKIIGCNATSGSGGGVYVGDYATFFYNSGSISGCSATVSGGGVYFSMYSSITMLIDSTDTTSLITGNSVPTAGAGGGVFTAGPTVTNSSTATIEAIVSGNTAGGTTETPGTYPQ